MTLSNLTTSLRPSVNSNARKSRERQQVVLREQNARVYAIASCRSRCDEQETYLACIRRSCCMWVMTAMSVRNAGMGTSWYMSGNASRRADGDADEKCNADGAKVQRRAHDVLASDAKVKMLEDRGVWRGVTSATMEEEVESRWRQD